MLKINPLLHVNKEDLFSKDPSEKIYQWGGILTYGYNFVNNNIPHQG